MDTKQLQKLQSQAKFRDAQHKKLSIRVAGGPTFTIDDRQRSNWERQLQASNRDYTIDEIHVDQVCPICNCNLEKGYSGYAEEWICPECGWSSTVE